MSTSSLITVCLYYLCVLQYLDIFEDLGDIEESTLSCFDAVMTKVRAAGDPAVAGTSSSLFRSRDSASSLQRSLRPNATRLRALVPGLLLRGAKISPTLGKQVTHVVVDFDNNYSFPREKALQV